MDAVLKTDPQDGSVDPAPISGAARPMRWLRFITIVFDAGQCSATLTDTKADVSVSNNYQRPLPTR
jgi:hypothetical protein